MRRHDPDFKHHKRSNLVTTVFSHQDSKAAMVRPAAVAATHAVGKDKRISVARVDLSAVGYDPSHSRSSSPHTYSHSRPVPAPTAIVRTATANRDIEASCYLTAMSSMQRCRIRQGSIVIASKGMHAFLLRCVHGTASFEQLLAVQRSQLCDAKKLHKAPFVCKTMVCFEIRRNCTRNCSRNLIASN